MSRILAFTDGACSGNPGPGGWGAILRGADGTVRELGGGAGSTTNNKMELTGAIEALRAAGKGPEPVDLYTDSTYVIHGIREWIHGWRRKGWKTASGSPVMNRELWEALDEATRLRTVEWRWVRGHAGYPGNERCDEIAVAFTKGEHVSLYRGPADAYEVDLTHLPANEPPPKRVAETKPSGPVVYLSLVDGRLGRHATWAECNARVRGRPGAKYRKASSKSEEEKILAGWGVE